MKHLREFLPRKKWLLLPVLLAVIAIVCFLALASRYLWIGGQPVPRAVSFLDLREEALTLSDYTRLQRKLPQCEILWNVPIGASRYPSDSESLPVQGLTGQDASMLDFFPRLKILDARGCTDYGTVSTLLSCRPDLVCRLTLAGEVVRSDAISLRVSNASLPELERVLPLMKQLERLELTGSLPSLSELRELQWAYPNVTIRREVVFQNHTISSDVTCLDLRNRKMDFASAEALLSWLPLLEQADMRGCGLTDEEMIRLTKGFPQTLLVWDMEVAGLRFPTDSVEIDISGRPVSDPEEVESVLSCFPRLERVIMSDCGLDDETMDALNRRNEDIRFVWTVYFRWFPVRTDALFFYPYKMDRRFPFRDEFCDADLYPLRYCTDMVSIDLGHDASVYTVEWAAFMPNLRYLILTECPVTDLTPLVNCKELVYLEMTKCWWEKDLSPLVECTALEDVNLGWSYPDPEPLSRMPWLKHIWWCSAKTAIGFPCSTAEALFAETLPDTITFFDGAHPVDGGWREFQTYYDMRDLMEMFYLR